MNKYPLFNSCHEGYAVILEELDELWDEVKKCKHDAKNLKAEALQVAAMAIKFIISLENDWKLKLIESESTRSLILSDEELLKNEAKCQACLYAVLNDEELDKLGTDPCDTCHNLSNWNEKGLDRA